MSKKATIQLETISPAGNKRVRTAKHSVTLEEFVAQMEDAVLSGRAVYAAVLMNGAIHMEMEA